MSNYAESHFLRLQDYIAGGSTGELTCEEEEYENLLFSCVGLARKEGRERALGWLMNDRGCSRHVAQRIYDESVNLFYASDGVKDQAWRNVLFQKLMDAAREFERQFFERDDEGKTAFVPKAKDYEAYARLLASAAKIRRLDQPDAKDDGPRQLVQQLTVISTDAQRAGLPATNVQEILSNPFFKQLPKKHQARLAMEAGAMPADIDTILDNSLELAHEASDE